MNATQREFRAFDAREITTSELARYRVTLNGLEVNAVAADERGWVEVLLAVETAGVKRRPILAKGRELRVGESTFRGWLTYFVVGFVQIEERCR